MAVNHLCIQNTRLLPKSESESLLPFVSTVVCKTQRYFDKLAELGLRSGNIANTTALLYIYMPIIRKEIYNLNSSACGMPISFGHRKIDQEWFLESQLICTSIHHHHLQKGMEGLRQSSLMEGQFMIMGLQFRKKNCNI